MCVIIFAENKRPSPQMVKDAWEKNSHGGGVAARVDDPNLGKKVVWWKKDLTLEEMQHYAATLEFPFVMHFRLNTSGGVLPELCHPYEVSFKTPWATEGFIDGDVLFHNGTWNANWSDRVLDIVLKTYDKGVELPEGKWGDTRAMAFCAAFYGRNFLDFIEQKGLVFGPEDYEIFWGKDGWVDVEGILCSNDRFVTKNKTYSICRVTDCKNAYDIQGGYCPVHRDNKEVAKSNPSGGSQSTNSTLVCMKCHALLAAGNPHNAGCVDAHLGTAAGILKDTCHECSAIMDIGEGHTATCSYRITGKPYPKPTLLKTNKLCQECKNSITDSRDHRIDCSNFLKGGWPQEAVPGGGRLSTPFLVLAVAEQERRAKRLSNNKFKKIKERLNMKYFNVEEMDLSKLLENHQAKLKDPRKEVVTH